MSARNWPPLRRRPPARHRDRLDLTPVPANLAASLPLPPPIVEPRPAPVPPRREPVTEVVCGFCGVTGLSSAIPDVADYGPRCADTDACARRWGNREAAARLAPAAEGPAGEAHPYPAPAPGAEPADEPGDECPIEVHLDGDRFPCQLNRGHDGSHEYGPREPWPDEEEGEPAPATDATAVLLEMAKPEDAAKGPDATQVIAVTDAPTEAVPVVKEGEPDAS